MFAVPEIYDAYVDVLETMIENEITPEVFNAALDNTLEQLLPHFSDPPVRLAMVELLEENPNAVEEAEAIRDIRAAADQMRTDFMEQRVRLQQAIADYRGVGP